MFRVRVNFFRTLIESGLINVLHLIVFTIADGKGIPVSVLIKDMKL